MPSTFRDLQMLNTININVFNRHHWTMNSTSVLAPWMKTLRPPITTIQHTPGRCFPSMLWQLYLYKYVKRHWSTNYIVRDVASSRDKPAVPLTQLNTAKNKITWIQCRQIRSTSHHELFFDIMNPLNQLQIYDEYRWWYSFCPCSRALCLCSSVEILQLELAATACSRLNLPPSIFI